MSSSTVNLDKPLELIQKTYPLQSPGNNLEHVISSRSSLVKISTHQPSRKSSVHDIHESNRDDLNKILADIQANLSRLKFLLESMQSVPTIREEFFKLKDHLFVKIFEFLSKLPNESTQRGSVSSRATLSQSFLAHPQHLISSMEHLRSELCKSKYLFTSLIISASIGTATLDSLEIHPVSNHSFNEQIQEENQDVMQMSKDINKLEEHLYILSQKYYSHIPDWQQTDGTRTDETTGKKIDAFNVPRLAGVQWSGKLSTTSSIASFDQSSFCARLYRKCQNLCCFCRPNYI